jgi:sugar phosphate isomerase/epimerase
MTMTQTTEPLAVQLYTLRKLSDSFDDILAAVASAGFRAVETVGTHGLSTEQMQEKLMAHGLRVVSSHVALNALKDNPDEVIAFNQANGNTTLVVPYLMPDQRPNDAAGWRELGRTLAGLGRTCREQGARLLYHNHDFEMQTFDGQLAIDWLFADAAPDELDFEPDLAWVVRGGQDPLAVLERYAGRCPRVHVKDIAPAGQNQDEDGWADVGSGTLDWARYLQAAKQAGAEWFVVVHALP